MKPTAVFWPGEFQGQTSLMGYSPWRRKEPAITEQLTCSLLMGQMCQCSGLFTTNSLSYSSVHLGEVLGPQVC